LFYCEVLVGRLTGDDVIDIERNILFKEFIVSHHIELYFTRKMSFFPELVFPSIPPSVFPVT